MGALVYFWPSPADVARLEDVEGLTKQVGMRVARLRHVCVSSSSVTSLSRLFPCSMLIYLSLSHSLPPLSLAYPANSRLSSSIPLPVIYSSLIPPYNWSLLWLCILTLLIHPSPMLHVCPYPCTPPPLVYRMSNLPPYIPAYLRTPLAPRLHLQSYYWNIQLHRYDRPHSMPASSQNHAPIQHLIPQLFCPLVSYILLHICICVCLFVFLSLF
ncbi:hypothetical protein JB92DRAFT_1811450 [Gautieria morchelliformis]|nr:hypothetical protein JB92DRAFT_1811450 [Gautieria morchelliformis]